MVIRSGVFFILSTYLIQVYAGVLYPDTSRPVLVLDDDSSEIQSSSKPIVIPCPSHNPEIIRVKGGSLNPPRIYLRGVEPKQFFHHQHIPHPAFLEESSENFSFFDSDSEDFDVNFSDDDYEPHFNYLPYSFNFMDFSESSEDSSEETPYLNPYVSHVVTSPHLTYPEKVIIPHQQKKVYS